MKTLQHKIYIGVDKLKATGENCIYVEIFEEWRKKMLKKGRKAGTRFLTNSPFISRQKHCMEEREKKASFKKEKF